MSASFVDPATDFVGELLRLVRTPPSRSARPEPPNLVSGPTAPFSAASELGAGAGLPTTAAAAPEAPAVPAPAAPLAAATPLKGPGRRPRTRHSVAPDQGSNDAPPVAQRLLSREPCSPVGDLGDTYLSVAALAEYASVSVRTVRNWLKDPVNPLPHYRVGHGTGKLLVRRSDFDRWMGQHRVEGDATDIDAMVREVMGDIA